jgi:hypothetical protein
MVRAHLQLHPPRTPSPPLPAATVLLLRDADHGIEVLMTRRSLTASFAPGAERVSGGGIDNADANSHHLANRRPSQNDLRLTQAIAAIRGSFEKQLRRALSQTRRWQTRIRPNPEQPCSRARRFCRAMCRP